MRRRPAAEFLPVDPSHVAEVTRRHRQRSTGDRGRADDRRPARPGPPCQTSRGRRSVTACGHADRCAPLARRRSALTGAASDRRRQHPPSRRAAPAGRRDGGPSSRSAPAPTARRRSSSPRQAASAPGGTIPLRRAASPRHPVRHGAAGRAPAPSASRPSAFRGAGGRRRPPLDRAAQAAHDRPAAGGPAHRPASSDPLGHAVHRWPATTPARSRRWS